ncbi:MAG: NAD(P)H-dependent oxidoreductase [Gluconacetobacter diazotrophicus]|nr:NAD(P)H-dependent oxidoreductase [Gluconacetobacter diazotrophicus]
MPTLLHLDSSPMGDASISRHLTAEFVREWRQAHPDGQVIRRDLTATDLPLISAEWVGAAYTPKEARSDAQRALLAPSDEFIAELRAADEYVLGVPMHNFTIPARLRLWVDLVARVGETFSYGSTGPVGLLKDKRATFVVASGGLYGEGAAMASYNFVDPYLRAVFGFLGVSEPRLVPAWGASGIRTGQIEREAFLAPPTRAIHALFHAA